MVTSHATAKLTIRQKAHQLREDGLALIHPPLSSNPQNRLSGPFAVQIAATTKSPQLAGSKGVTRRQKVLYRTLVKYLKPPPSGQFGNSPCTGLTATLIHFLYAGLTGLRFLLLLADRVLRHKRWRPSGSTGRTASPPRRHRAKPTRVDSSGSISTARFTERWKTADLASHYEDLELRRGTAPKRGDREGDQTRQNGAEQKTNDERQLPIYQSDRGLQEPHTDFPGIVSETI